MGLFDFLQPGWKKDADKAVETIRKSDNILMILKVLDESGFSGKDREKINAAAVSSLSQISLKHREAAECLASFAKDGESSLLRCQAA